MRSGTWRRGIVIERAESGKGIEVYVLLEDVFCA